MSRETILVVDDEESIRKSLVDIFTDEGYEVLTAGSGAEGVEMLRKYQPALAILDVVLPGSRGGARITGERGLANDWPVYRVRGDECGRVGT